MVDSQVVTGPSVLTFFLPRIPRSLFFFFLQSFIPLSLSFFLPSFLTLCTVGAYGLEVGIPADICSAEEAIFTQGAAEP